MSTYRLYYIIFLIILSVMLIYMSGTRTPGIDPDSLMYTGIVSQFNTVSSINLSSKEPGFWLFVFISNIISAHNVTVLFFIYAICSISSKIILLNKISPHPLISIILYIGFYYIIHDLTQIRIGFAVVFFLLQYWSLSNGCLQKAIIYYICGVLFHYSISFALILFFIPKNSKKISFIYLCFPVMGLLLSKIISYSPIIKNLFSMMPSFISYKAGLYFDLYGDNGAGSDNHTLLVTGFGSIFLMIIIVHVFYIVNCKRKVITENIDVSKIIYLTKISSIQIFVGFLFLFNQEFSNRIYSYLGMLSFTILPAYYVNFYKQQKVIMFVLLLYSLKQLSTGLLFTLA